MESVVVIFTAISSLGVFALRGPTKYYLSLFLHFLLVVTASSWAFRALSSGGVMQFNLLETVDLSLPTSIDSLSAFFLIIISLTLLTCLLYAHGYLKLYRQTQSNRQFSLHYFALLWLHLSLLLVCTARGGGAFLGAWEVMTLAILYLALFEGGRKKFREAGLSYLVQLQLGTALLMVAFFIASSNGRPFGFDGLGAYFLDHAPLPLFLLLFIGFGSYAGFVPFHTWLPPINRVAPSHVSGILSGVLIQMGFYGILRILTYIHNDLLTISLILLSVSLLSGMVGIGAAFAQQDAKKLLAYSSIANTGIAGIGIGVGLLGTAFDVPVLTTLGFTGGILHLLHHALAKPLLFYSVGSVYRATNTRNLGQISGLINTMPKTSIAFLLGSLAICGLPPLSGYVSQFILYLGLFKGLGMESGFGNYLLWSMITGLACIQVYILIGYRKTFRKAFLGQPSPAVNSPITAVSDDMIMAQALLSMCLLALGLFPLFFIELASNVTALYTTNLQPIDAIEPGIIYTGLTGTLLVGLVFFAHWLRNRPAKPVKIGYHPPHSFTKNKREHWVG